MNYLKFFSVCSFFAINIHFIYSLKLFKTAQLREFCEPFENYSKTRIVKDNAHEVNNLIYSKPYNYCSDISRLINSKYKWSNLPISWQKRFRKLGYWICYRDCGGGGDCLYRSVISGLNLNNTSVAHLRNLVANEFVAFNQDKNNSLKPYLNNRAETLYNPRNEILIHSWNETLFLERMYLLATLEAANEWSDLWSPTDVLNKNSIDGVDISTNLKKALLVNKYLSRVGNTHWGSHWDVNHIESLYNVKIILFWKNKGIFYPTLGLENKYNRVLLICYDDQISHFQVIGLKKFTSGTSEFTTVYQKNKIPTSLKKLYLEDTKNQLD